MSDDPTIAPALTPKEWAEYLSGEPVERGFKSPDDWSDGWSVFSPSVYPGHLYVEQLRGTTDQHKLSGSIHHLPESLHTLAALALHGQPFGFTRDLLTRLRHAPHLTQLDAETFAISREDLRVLLGSRTEAAARIEALLPPEGV